MKFAVWQSFVEILGVDGRDDCVSAAEMICTGVWMCGRTSRSISSSVG
jgi:hypothetical protein